MPWKKLLSISMKDNIIRRVGDEPMSKEGMAYLK